MLWFEKIHHEALRCSRAYKRAEYQLVLAIQKVDGKKVYRKLGYASLFDYAVKALKLPEGNAYAFINVSRRAVQMPSIAEALQKGVVTVSQAKRVLSVIQPQTQDIWIDKAARLTQRELEREVAEVNPRAAVVEKIRPVATNRSRLECGIDDVLELKLQRAREVLSQKSRRPCSLEETLRAMVDDFLTRNDPMEKASRATKRLGVGAQTLGAGPEPWNERGSSGVSSRSVDRSGGKSRQMPSVRLPIPRAIKHQLYIRDGGACGFRRPDGSQCGSKYFIDVHHVKPVSQGGANDLSNLILLCRGHHRSLHEGLSPRPRVENSP